MRDSRPSCQTEGLSRCTFSEVLWLQAKLSRTRFERPSTVLEIFFYSKTFADKPRAVVSELVSSCDMFGAFVFEPLTSVPFSWRIEEMCFTRKSTSCKRFRNHRFIFQLNKCNIKSVDCSLNWIHVSVLNVLVVLICRSGNKGLLIFRNYWM